MLNPELLAILRKRWYFVLLAVAVIAGVVWIAHAYDLDPRTMLSRYGYKVVLIWTFLEGETIVILAGMFAEKLHLDPWLIAFYAFCGSFLSDQVMFSLGKYKGESVLRYFPRVARNVDKAGRLFKKYDTILILGFRFVYGVRNVTPILLGISGVSHLKFFILNFIGATVWALSFSFGGFYAGRAFMTVMDHVGHGIFYVLLAALALAGLIWFIRARRSVKNVREIAARTEENKPGQSGGP
mgnify:CR=1 FL=1